MSNIGLIIEERAASIGNFTVGRLLPFRQKKMVGPFIFIDHMGPAELGKEESFDVLPHPHIGLSTLTYLFEGTIMHRDSLGTSQEIKPGEVNWMTAGKGIVHSERTPERLRNQPMRMHGLQIWVALPADLEEMEPSFFHLDKEDIPAWTEAGIDYKLIAGEAMGKKSPVPVYSPLYMIELKATNGGEVSPGSTLFGETGLYILEGEVEAEGNTFGSKQILVANDSSICTFKMKPNTTVYLFGGKPFPERRYIDWNFVATSREKLEAAREKWRKQDFPKIEGESGFVPLPK